MFPFLTTIETNMLCGKSLKLKKSNLVVQYMLSFSNYLCSEQQICFKKGEILRFPSGSLTVM